MVVGGLSAVASPTFIDEQQKMAAYRTQKLDQLKEQNDLREKDRSERLEELEIGKLSDITKDILPGFHKQVNDEYQNTVSKVIDLFEQPSRTNVEKTAKFDELFMDFRNKLNPMVATSKYIQDALKTPDDKLNVEQKSLVPSLYQFANGETDWDGLMTGIAHVPNALGSYFADPKGFGFKINHQEMGNPENLFDPKSKGNIVGAMAGLMKYKNDPETGLLVGGISKEDAATLSAQVMSTNPEFAPGAGMFNGMLNAGYASANEDGTMAYQKPVKDANGNTTGLTTRPVPELRDKMQSELSDMIYMQGQKIRNISPYSEYAEQMKLRDRMAIIENQRQNIGEQKYYEQKQKLADYVLEHKEDTKIEDSGQTDLLGKPITKRVPKYSAEDIALAEKEREESLEGLRKQEGHPKDAKNEHLERHHKDDPFQ